jgi:rhamnosyltransferase
MNLSNPLPIPRVLILLATYNGEEHIELQLKSIFDQHNVSISVLISDDCSSDLTIEKINYFVEKKFPITFLSLDKKFGSAAPNFFYLVANSICDDFDYVAFSDQDDIWFDQKIISAINVIKEKKVNGFSSDVIAYWPESNAKKLIKKSYSQTSWDHFFESPGPGCTQVLTKESFLKFQKFVCININKINNVDYHDWFIYAYYRYNDLGWYISSKPNMYYVQHSRNQIGANKGIHAVISRIKMIYGGWYAQQVELTYEIISNDNEKLLSPYFLIRNILKIRRKKFESIIASFCLIIGRR